MNLVIYTYIYDHWINLKLFIVVFIQKTACVNLVSIMDRHSIAKNPCMHAPARLKTRADSANRTIFTLLQ